MTMYEYRSDDNPRAMPLGTGTSLGELDASE